MTFKTAISHLTSWYEYHHGGCDDCTCHMAEAWSQGLPVIAIDGLLSAININVNNSYDQETEALALKAYNTIQRRFKKRWEALVSKENKELLKLSHARCNLCGVVTWQPEFCGDSCGGCGHKFETPEASDE